MLMPIAPTLVVPVINVAMSVFVVTVLLPGPGEAIFQAPAVSHAVEPPAHVPSAAEAVVGSDTIAAMLTRLVAKVRAKRRTCRSMDGLLGVVLAEVVFVVLIRAMLMSGSPCTLERLGRLGAMRSQFVRRAA